MANDSPQGEVFVVLIWLAIVVGAVWVLATAERPEPAGSPAIPADRAGTTTTVEPGPRPATGAPASSTRSSLVDRETYSRHVDDHLDDLGAELLAEEGEASLDGYAAAEYERYLSEYEAYQDSLDHLGREWQAESASQDDLDRMFEGDFP
jgi:hypothetical protein